MLQDGLLAEHHTPEEDMQHHSCLDCVDGLQSLFLSHVRGVSVVVDQHVFVSPVQREADDNPEYVQGGHGGGVGDDDQNHADESSVAIFNVEMHPHVHILIVLLDQMLGPLLAALARLVIAPADCLTHEIHV